MRMAGPSRAAREKLRLQRAHRPIEGRCQGGNRAAHATTCGGGGASPRCAFPETQLAECDDGATQRPRKNEESALRLHLCRKARPRSPTCRPTYGPCGHRGLPLHGPVAWSCTVLPRRRLGSASRENPEGTTARQRLLVSRASGTHQRQKNAHVWGGRRVSRRRVGKPPGPTHVTAHSVELRGHHQCQRPRNSGR